MANVKRDMSDEVGFHYTLDLEDDFGSSVEVDAFRIHSEGQVFIELWGNRASDSVPDSVVVALPLECVGSVAQALTAAHRYLRQNGTVK